MKMGRRIRVKICGMTKVEDALFAVREGVDALGFIFYPKSPRCVDLKSAEGIIKALPPFVDKVGVFVNATGANIEKSVSVGLTAIQLHGDESPDFCMELRKRFPAITLFKAFRVGSESTASEFSQYHDIVDGFLLDTYVKGAKGGTGEVFDWSIIESLHLTKPVLLAGGLSPENIGEAIRSARPYCLDVNSGVETSPGIKDAGKIARLMSIVRQTAK